jgi:DNA-directed RNA polymerase III subunit RPC4
MKHDDENRRGGGGGGGGAGSSRVKREDGGYVSSGEDDDDVEFPRQDIDFIEITSDVEEAESSASKDKLPRTQNASTLMPIRIGRKEHQDRVVGINTEASSTASARVLQPSGSRTEIKREGGGTSSTSRKGKGKARDVEITGESKPFRGMWQESEEVQLKSEPQSDDENLPDAEPAGLSEAPPQELKDQPPSSPELGRKPKSRGRMRAEPAFQTEEDRAEWERLQANLENVRRELGPDEDTPAVDANGDAIMQDPNEPKRSVRDDYVYLFQFPPTMPIFPAQGVKQEPMEGDQPAAASVPDKKSAIVDESDPVTKIRKKTKHMNINPGAAGKLRVHESGRTTLNWGGQTFELTPGLEATNLQEIVHVNVVPEKERVVPEEGGESTSFSRMKGQFIVSPAWKNLLR